MVKVWYNKSTGQIRKGERPRGGGWDKIKLTGHAAHQVLKAGTLEGAYIQSTRGRGIQVGRPRDTGGSGLGKFQYPSTGIQVRQPSQRILPSYLKEIRNAQGQVTGYEDARLQQSYQASELYKLHPELLSVASQLKESFNPQEIINRERDQIAQEVESASKGNLRAIRNERGEVSGFEDVVGQRSVPYNAIVRKDLKTGTTTIQYGTSGRYSPSSRIRDRWTPGMDSYDSSDNLGYSESQKPVSEFQAVEKPAWKLESLDPWERLSYETAIAKEELVAEREAGGFDFGTRLKGAAAGALAFTILPIGTFVRHPISTIENILGLVTSPSELSKQFEMLGTDIATAPEYITGGILGLAGSKVFKVIKGTGAFRLIESKVNPYALASENIFFDEPMRGRVPGYIVEEIPGIGKNVKFKETPSQFVTPEQQLSLLSGKTRTLAHVDVGPPPFGFKSSFEVIEQPGSSILRTFSGGAEKGFFWAAEEVKIKPVNIPLLERIGKEGVALEPTISKLPKVTKTQAKILRLVGERGDIVSGSFAQKTLFPNARAFKDIDIISRAPAKLARQIEELGIAKAKEGLQGRYTIISKRGKALLDIVPETLYRGDKTFGGLGKVRSYEVEGINVLEPNILLKRKIETAIYVSKSRTKALKDINFLTGKKYKLSELRKVTEQTTPQAYTYYAGLGNKGIDDFFEALKSGNVKLGIGKASPSITFARTKIAQVPRELLASPITKAEKQAISMDLLKIKQGAFKGLTVSDADRLVQKYGFEGLALHRRLATRLNAPGQTVPGIGALSGLRSEYETITTAGSRITRETKTFRGKFGQLLGSRKGSYFVRLPSGEKFEIFYSKVVRSEAPKALGQATDLLKVKTKPTPELLASHYRGLLESSQPKVYFDISAPLKNLAKPMIPLASAKEKSIKATAITSAKASGISIKPSISSFSKVISSAKPSSSSLSLKSPAPSRSSFISRASRTSGVSRISKSSGGSSSGGSGGGSSGWSRKSRGRSTRYPIPPKYSPPKYSPPKYPPSQRQQEISKKQALGFAQAFKVFVRQKGKWRSIGSKLPLGLALEKGVKVTKQTLSAQFKLVPEGTTKLRDIGFRPSARTFREYRIRKGQRLRTPLQFIQKTTQEGGERKGRLAVKSEVFELRSSRSKKSKLKGGWFI